MTVITFPENLVSLEFLVFEIQIKKKRKSPTSTVENLNCHWIIIIFINRDIYVLRRGQVIRYDFYKLVYFIAPVSSEIGHAHFSTNGSETIFFQK